MNALDYWKDLAIILAGLVGFITFFSGVLEYARQGRFKRAEQFVHMRRRFLETPLFQDILHLLPTDSEKLTEIPIQDRRNFVGFLEEVALMVNSKLIDGGIAHYMFGYYVILAARSEQLWVGLERTSIYWTVFHEFAATMESQAKRGSPALSDLRF